MECSENTEIIEKNACVQAAVRVIPQAGAGAISLEYIGEPTRESCEGAACSKCDFVISQMICLKIPMSFSANAQVVAVGIACENEPPPACDQSPCGDTGEYERFRDNRRYPDNGGRSFARNYQLTHRNNTNLT